MADYDIIIITTRLPRKLTLSKNELKQALEKLGYEIIRIQRVRRFS